MIKNNVQRANGNKPASAGALACVTGFIEQVWNENAFSDMSAYLHEDFVDHSLPFSCVQNKDGLLIYLKHMATTVSHKTEILKLNMLDELVICKIRVSTCHLSALDTESIEGYRVFKMCDNKIIAHWEMF